MHTPGKIYEYPTEADHMNPRSVEEAEAWIATENNYIDRLLVDLANTRRRIEEFTRRRDQLRAARAAQAVTVGGPDDEF